MPSLLASLLGGPASQEKQPRPFDDFWYEITRLTASGMRLGLREAMSVPAFRRCLVVLSGAIASLPFIIYRRVSGGKERAPEHPLYRS
jgi:phage portal protein BeeE